MCCDSRVRRYGAAVLVALFSLALASCGGGGGGGGATTTTSYTVTAIAGAGGSISPVSASVTSGATANFTVTPDSGSSINTVTGCGGALAGSTYTTGAVTSDCAVTASFVSGSVLPAVTSFTAAATTIPAGSSVNLSAVFAGGTGSIDNGVGSVTSGTSVSVTPTITTTYTLRVVNATGSVTSTVTVNVLGLSALSITGASLDQFFQANLLAYTATVGFVTSSVTVTAITDNAGATITVNGVAVGVGNASPSIALVEGINPAINIVVTSTDLTTVTYIVTITRQFASVLAQQAYIKASNTGVNDQFGYSISLSGDTIAVGTVQTGAVYVFVRSGSTWLQQAYIQPSNAGITFGYSVALFGDTLAVGHYAERSAATGMNGDEADTSAFDSGAVYVFTRSGSTWTQQAYIKASNTDPGDKFGISVALYEDTLAVGAQGEGSVAIGVNGSQTDNSATNSGAVYVFTRSGPTWTQQAYIKASNTDSADGLGYSIALSGDTLAVSALNEGSTATGINGDQMNNTAPGGAGAVYVFTRSGSTWAQQAYIKASNTDLGDWFGYSVALSGDTLAVGAQQEDSVATGVNNNGQADNSASFAGAAYVFIRSGITWSQQAYIKASNTDARDRFGSSVALSGDTLLIGATSEASISSGVNADQTNNDARGKGAAYMFTRTGTVWAQQAYIKASNAIYAERFGSGVSIFANMLVISASGEPSSSTGINGNETNTGARNSGAVYVFE